MPKVLNCGNGTAGWQGNGKKGQGRTLEEEGEKRRWDKEKRGDVTE